MYFYPKLFIFKGQITSKLQTTEPYTQNSLRVLKNKECQGTMRVKFSFLKSQAIM